MSITAYTQAYMDDVVVVTVTSTLSGTVYYHWYMDGSYIATTLAPSKEFRLEAGDQVRIDVVDNNDPDFDPVANSPAGYPARRTIFWCRSLATDVDHYRVEQKKNVEAWEVIGIVPHDDDTWSYHLLSGRLGDFPSAAANYQWRVIPVDTKGNDGTAVTLAAERVVQRPPSPDFTISFDDGTTEVTFAAA